MEACVGELDFFGESIPATRVINSLSENGETNDDEREAIKSCNTTERSPGVCGIDVRIYTPPTPHTKPASHPVTCLLYLSGLLKHRLTLKIPLPRGL